MVEPPVGSVFEPPVEPAVDSQLLPVPPRMMTLIVSVLWLPAVAELFAQLNPLPVDRQVESLLPLLKVVWMSQRRLRDQG